MEEKKSYKLERSWTLGPWEFVEEFDEEWEAQFERILAIDYGSDEWTYRIRYVEERSKIID
jgi:hypothetical protein|tara:strand:+ start:3694 stop:3876 length:183 start_codon:yes stop_codon:yes gene_type:complete